MEYKLIEIYLLVCHSYDMNNHLHLQENRNNLPTITATELVTIYLFGQLNRHFKTPRRETTLTRSPSFIFIFIAVSG